jgi:ABC-2 type transport system permease protein
VNVSTHGVATVAAQEFRLRNRAGRWRWLLAIWFGVLLLFTALVWLALERSLGPDEERGTPMFGALMLFVLALALLVVPALTAQSVNGDRERGTLATLQVTLLTPAEIALGKLAAAWGTALVFLGLSLPLVVWCVAAGGVTLDRLLATLGVVALLLGVVCAIGLALSALLTRSTTSAVLSYLGVFVLTVGTLVAFGLAAALTTETVTRQERVPVFDQTGRTTIYTTESYRRTEPRPDRVWWLLAPNPFVILADAAPQLPPQRDPVTGSETAQTDVDVLGGIGLAVREMRLPPDRSEGTLSAGHRGPAVWPYGLAADLALGAAAVYLTARRLETPSRRLPRGVRIA